MKNYSLVGISGNEYSIVGYITTCMREECRSEDEIAEYVKKSKNMPYGDLLIYSIEIIGQLNQDDGCEYCEKVGKEYDRYSFYNTFSKSPDVYIDEDGDLCIDSGESYYDDNSFSVNIHINYCPFCGRKLK